MESIDGDSSVISRLAAGDAEAAREFESRYRLRLIRFARASGVPSGDVEDLVQEVMLAAIQQFQRGHFQGRSSLGTWLVGILRNKTSAYWRGRGQAVSAGISELSDEANALCAYEPRLDDAIDIRMILDGLPQRHRVILLLNVTERYTTVEIAAILRVKAGSVGRKLAEAKRMVRDATNEQAPRRDLGRGSEESSGGLRLTS